MIRMVEKQTEQEVENNMATGYVHVCMGVRRGIVMYRPSHLNRMWWHAVRSFTRTVLEYPCIVKIVRSLSIL